MADRTPNTRLEKWMAKIAGETVDITPKDRLETLLAKIAGESVSITPDDTLEYWLNQIAENGGGGGSSDFTTATVTVTVDDTQQAGRYDYPTVATIEFYDDVYVLDGSQLIGLTDDNKTVLLYKGAYYIYANDDDGSDNGVVSISGAVVKTTLEDTNVYEITGNCTFVIKPSQIN